MGGGARLIGRMIGPIAEAVSHVISSASEMFFIDFCSGSACMLLIVSHQNVMCNSTTGVSVPSG